MFPCSASEDDDDGAQDPVDVCEKDCGGDDGEDFGEEQRKALQIMEFQRSRDSNRIERMTDSETTEHELNLVLFSVGDLSSEQLSRVWFRRPFDKHKCRLVVLGNLFRRGKDCSRNTWAPTASATAVRVFLYVTVQLGYPIWKFDIRTAFLLALADGKYYCFYPALFRLAEMTEEELLETRRIVMHGTEGEQRKLKRELCGKYSDDEDRVLEILRSVYGSPSAPRCFYLHFREILRSMGWTPTESEPCLFQKEFAKGKYMRMVIHVDVQRDARLHGSGS